MWEQLKKRSGHPTHKDNEDLLQGDDYVFKQEYKKMCKEQILSNPYYNKINKNFIDWDRVSIPSEVNRLGPNYIERISERDKHPNENGQKQIARLIYDRLG
tara:strand:- start:178 stop:480 length:303 start_codon:yes stop_codon:yes gene_type:complete